MTDLELLATPAKNIKLRTAYRDAGYHVLRDGEKTEVFSKITNTFAVAFAIGFHFKQRKPIGRPSINHVNVTSLDRDFKELAVLLVTKHHPEISSAERVWQAIEEYAEYGIEVLIESWRRHKRVEVAALLGSP